MSFVQKARLPSSLKLLILFGARLEALGANRTVAERIARNKIFVTGRDRKLHFSRNRTAYGTGLFASDRRINSEGPFSVVQDIKALLDPVRKQILKDKEPADTGGPWTCRKARKPDSHINGVKLGGEHMDAVA